jgi:hypothetical protein
MNAWERYWFAPVAAIRPFVLERTVLFLLALDVWTQCVPHGARYGAGDFNVAHFAWLDAVQPMPSPSLHVGLMLIVGGLAWVVACGAGGRRMRLLLATLYTYGWAMSRLDAYQHHYLLSLLLAAFVFFPRVRATDSDVSAWAFVVVAANVAIVYVFAAVTKSDAAWASGGVLRQVTANSGWFQWMWSRLLATGVDEDALWGLTARAVAAMQVLIAVAYVAVVRADLRRARWARMLAWAALAAAVGFHGSLLFFAVQIRWFSYYMIAIAVAVFAPEAWLRRLGALATLPARTIARHGARWATARRTAALACGAACIVTVAGSWLDLPGATAAGALGGMALATMAVSRSDGARTRHRAVAAAAGALVLVVAVHVTPVRFQYYLYLVADLQRRGAPAEVLAAYEKAEPYAPAGESRRRQIEALRIAQRTSPAR